MGKTLNPRERVKCEEVENTHVYYEIALEYSKQQQKTTSQAQKEQNINLNDDLGSLKNIKIEAILEVCIKLLKKKIK